MNPQINYILAQEHIAELHRAGRHRQLATEAATARRNSRKRNSTPRLARLTARLARLAPSLS